MDEAVKRPTRVGLFVTCLVDLMRPSVGFAAVKLLEDAGCQVVVPSQTCCGQPAYNSGDRATAKAIARQTIAAFATCDWVVAPSGSCAGMLAEHYPELFADEPQMAIEAKAFSAKCHELVSFLVDRLGVEKVSARYEGAVAYHDSCSGLREMSVKSQPRKLLASVMRRIPLCLGRRPAMMARLRWPPRRTRTRTTTNPPFARKPTARARSRRVGCSTRVTVASRRQCKRRSCRRSAPSSPRVRWNEIAMCR